MKVNESGLKQDCLWVIVSALYSPVVGGIRWRKLALGSFLRNSLSQNPLFESFTTLCFTLLVLAEEVKTWPIPC